MQYIVTIDQGTTGTTGILFDREGRPVRKYTRKVTQYYPRPGWVEHDATEIWKGVFEILAQMAAEVPLAAGDLAGIGIANQRETVVAWDPRTGHPLHRAIVWQCRRTADACRRLKKEGWEAEIHRRTGLFADPYFSGTKIQWLLDHIPRARERVDKGEILVGTIDSWIVWNLTGGRIHATDVTNASRTLLFDIESLCWSDRLLDLFQVPAGVLPQVNPSAGDFGETEVVPGFPDGVPITACCGDQQAALFGQTCYTPGTVKNTYGTGAFLLMHAGESRPNSGKGLLATVAWALGDLDKVEYAVEGSVFVAGAVVQWLKDGLGLLDDAAESEAMARSVDDTGGVYLVPAFTGLGAPVWDPYARGAILGLTRGTQREHLVRAALESIAYQSRDVVGAMQEAVGRELQGMRVDGGAAVNDFLMQFQADILGVAIERPAVVETTALGACYLAGLGVGVWKDKESLRRLWQRECTFIPQMPAARRRSLYSGWLEARSRAEAWESPAPQV